MCSEFDFYRKLHATFSLSIHKYQRSILSREQPIRPHYYLNYWKNGRLKIIIEELQLAVSALPISVALVLFDRQKEMG